jgi:hypothetical protein
MREFSPILHPDLSIEPAGNAVSVSMGVVEWPTLSGGCWMGLLFVGMVRRCVTEWASRGDASLEEVWKFCHSRVHQVHHRAVSIARNDFSGFVLWCLVMILRLVTTNLLDHLQ